jgi:ribonuclease BN (tRNA processing enzyme)
VACNLARPAAAKKQVSGKKKEALLKAPALPSEYLSTHGRRTSPNGSVEIDTGRLWSFFGVASMMSHRTVVCSALTIRLVLALTVLVAKMSEFAVAQQTSSKTTTLITLGTQGGPVQSKSRAQPANVLLVNNEAYIIDAGSGVARQLALAGVPLGRVGHIFITHNHDDHNADVGTMMGLAWDIGRSAPITVYGPKGTTDMMDGFLKYFAPNRDIRRGDFPDFYKTMPEQVFVVREIERAGSIHKDANVRVDALENCHFHFPVAASNSKSYALRFTTPDKVIVFSGDTGPCEPLVDFAMGADILVHEVINLELYEAVLKTRLWSSEQRQNVLRHMREDHATPDVIGKVAAKAKVGMVVLSHIIPGAENDPDSAYSGGVSAHYSGVVVVAKDLMRF